MERRTNKPLGHLTQSTPTPLPPIKLNSITINFNSTASHPFYIGDDDDDATSSNYIESNHIQSNDIESSDIKLIYIKPNDIELSEIELNYTKLNDIE